MSIQQQFTQLRADYYNRYRSCVVTKDKYRPWLWKAMDRALRIVSFGKITTFMQRTTTLGKVIAFPAGTDFEDPSAWELLTLKHEGSGHVSQFARFGIVGMALLYLLVPLPIGLAYFRYRFEREAFVHEINYAHSHGLKIDVVSIVNSLSGPGYFWAWPKAWVWKWFVKQGLL